MKLSKLAKFFGEPIEAEIDGQKVVIDPPKASDLSTIMEITYLVEKLNTEGAWTPEEGERFMDIVVKFVYHGLKPHYEGLTIDDVRNMRPDIVLQLFRIRAGMGGIEVSQNFRPDDYIAKQGKKRKAKRA